MATLNKYYIQIGRNKKYILILSNIYNELNENYYFLPTSSKVLKKRCISVELKSILRKRISVGLIIILKKFIPVELIVTPKLCCKICRIVM